MNSIVSLLFEMYAIVDFINEKAQDGTTPCEIVHMSWVSADMKTCFWPGNQKYCKAFKNGGDPELSWSTCAVKVKFFSADYESTREHRDNILNGSSGTELSDRPTVNVSARKRAAPNYESDSSDSDGDRIPKPKKKLPKPPIISTSYFGLLNSEASLHVPDSVASTSSAQSHIVLEKDDCAEVLITTGSVISENTPNRIKDLDKSILRRLERLERKIDDVHEFMRKLKESGGTFTNIPEDAPSLPLRDVGDLELLESYLLSESSMPLMVSYVAKTGGSGVKEATERIMAAILSNTVALQLNWKGVVKKSVTPKIGIKKYPMIVKLIKGGVQTIETKATDKMIEEWIKYWLKHAKRRGLD